MLRRPFRWAVVALFAAACGAADVPGSDVNAASGSPRATVRAPARASSTVPLPTKTEGLVGIEVQMGDHYIDPVSLTVKVGATVVWRNSSGQHDVTARDGSFRSPTLGEAYAHTFTQPGRYPYFCSFHQAEMRGEIVVEPAK